MVGRVGRAAAEGAAGSRLARALICLLSQALAGASTYATAQFYTLTVSGQYGSFLHLSWANMLTPMLTYTDPHAIPLTIGLLTLGWLLALDVASAMTDDATYEILGKIRYLYIFTGLATVLLGLLLIGGISALVGFVNGAPWLGLPQFATGTVIGFILALSGYVSFATARPAFGPPQ